LLRKDQAPALKVLQQTVKDGLRFLGEPTDQERAIAGDPARRLHAEVVALAAALASA
jgi:hypothetical protein